MSMVCERFDDGTAWLEPIVARFEAACGSGNWPAIDDYLPDGDGRRTVLVELVHADLELRLRAGEPAHAAAYLERYPELALDGAASRELIAREEELRRRQVAAPSPATARRPRDEGSRLGKFELHAVVGSGSFGVVYRARDVELDRLVAVKVPLAVRLASDEEAERFLREARNAARLRHPGLVAVYEAGRIDGDCYLVSELIEGTTLAERLRDGGMCPTSAAELVAQVAEALDHAHRHEVIHRDIKPSNILLDREGRPHLADFGLARRVSNESTLTIDGQVLGTPAYMSPEQARGESHRVDARSDVYSLGIVLYELLAGALPFRGSPRALMAQVCDDEAPPPRRHDGAVPRDLETVCRKAIAREPGHRYPTAAALADDLRRYLLGVPVQARPVGPATRLWRRCRRRPLVAGLAACLMLTLTLGLVGVQWQRRRGEAHRQRVHAAMNHNQRILFVLATLLGDKPTGDPQLRARRVQQVRALLEQSDRLMTMVREDSTSRHVLVRMREQIGGVLLRVGARDEARDVLRDARADWESIDRESPDDLHTIEGLAGIDAKLVSLLIADGQSTAAGRHFDQARALWLRAQDHLAERARRDPREPIYRRRLANNYRNLAYLMLADGRTAEAIAYDRQARDIRATVVPDGSQDGDERILLANRSMKAGYGLRQAGRPTDATRNFQLSRDLLGDIVRGKPDAIVPRDKLARACFTLGELHRAAGRPVEALENFQRGGSLWEDLARGDTSAYRGERSRCFYLLGAAQATLSQTADALRSYRIAAELFEGLIRGHPADPGARRGLGCSHDNIGNLLVELDQPIDAIAAYRQAMRIWDALCREFPDRQDLRSDCAGTRRNLAEALELVGRGGEADSSPLPAGTSRGTESLPPPGPTRPTAWASLRR